MDANPLFSRYDRCFLRGLYINPEATLAQDAIDTIEALSERTQFNPPTFVISWQTALKVIEEFGELNWDTYMAYRVAHTKAIDG